MRKFLIIVLSVAVLACILFKPGQLSSDSKQDQLVTDSKEMADSEMQIAFNDLSGESVVLEDLGLLLANHVRGAPPGTQYQKTSTRNDDHVIGKSAEDSDSILL